MGLEYGLLWSDRTPAPHNIDGPFGSMILARRAARAHIAESPPTDTPLEYALLRRRPGEEWTDFQGRDALAAYTQRWGSEDRS